MQLAKVVGQVVATRKDAGLAGTRMLLVQPLTREGRPGGRIQVAVDGVQSRSGERVLCVRAREASLAIPGRRIPCDLSIVATVEDVGE